MQFARSRAIVSGHHLASIGVERGRVVLHVRRIPGATSILDKGMASARWGLRMQVQVLDRRPLRRDWDRAHCVLLLYSVQHIDLTASACMLDLCL